MLLELLDEALSRSVTAEKEPRVLFVEDLEPSVGADGGLRLDCRVRPDW
jgi:hypothetical protein